MMVVFNTEESSDRWEGMWKKITTNYDTDTCMHNCFLLTENALVFM